MRKIGVFDSGVGGEIVAKNIRKSFPKDNVLFVSDKEHLPYGNRPISEIFSLALSKLRSLEAEGCDVIVVACNTVTTNCIDDLRTEVTVPLIGMEPMIKPASLLTKSKAITVCATPATLRSTRYAWLKNTYTQGMSIYEPDCSDWASLIETNMLDQEKIRQVVNSSKEKGSDVIVLGCTHYHWIEDRITQECGDDIVVIQPEEAVMKQLSRVLARMS